MRPQWHVAWRRSKRSTLFTWWPADFQRGPSMNESQVGGREKEDIETNFLSLFPSSNHADMAVKLAIEIYRIISNYRVAFITKKFTVRIGIASGPVVAGIIGKTKYSYDCMYSPRPTLCLSLQFCFVLFCFVLFCFVLFCFVLFCFVLFCFVLFCFVLFCFVLFCFLCYVFCRNVLISFLSSGWSDTTNTASRMESNGWNSYLQATSETFSLISNKSYFQKRGIQEGRRELRRASRIERDIKIYYKVQLMHALFYFF